MSWLRRTYRPLRRGAHELTSRLRAVVGKGSGVRVRAADDWTVTVAPVGYEDLRYWLRYEAPTFAMLQRVWRAGMAVLDLGAHHGLFSACCCRPGSLPSRILAVEPSLAAQPQLQANRAVHPDVAWTNVLAAVGEQEGRLRLHPGLIHMLVVDPALHGRSGSNHAPDAVEVRLTSVDILCREHRLTPSLVKVDVEGYEAEALRGAHEMLKRDRPIVFLEWHCSMLRQRGLDPLNALEPLTTAGYRFEPFEHPELGIVSASALPTFPPEDIYRMCCHP